MAEEKKQKKQQNEVGVKLVHLSEAGAHARESNHLI